MLIFNTSPPPPKPFKLKKGKFVLFLTVITHRIVQILMCIRYEWCFVHRDEKEGFPLKNQNYILSMDSIINYKGNCRDSYKRKINKLLIIMHFFIVFIVHNL